ncbi:MAG: BspA family leucine-rich repeat surface protein [Bacteroidales bacterium]|nr:BspA family leucine-rich repeat surface protein [Bacteroidales bacterium]
MKHIITIIAILILSTASISAQEAYALMSPDSTTLTFYYDTQKATREGTAYELNDNNKLPQWCQMNKMLAAPWNPHFTKVVFDNSFKETRPKSCSDWFAGFHNVVSIEGIENLNTSEVTTFSSMFYQCQSLKNIDLRGFNTNKVTNMNRMFSCCENLTNLDLSSFNTDKVEDIDYMFYRCTRIETIDLSSFNTQSVKKMNGVFMKCTNLQYIDLSSFKTANVTDISDMFSNCYHLKTIYVDKDKWLLNNDLITNDENLFYNCISLYGEKGTICISDKNGVKFACIDQGPSKPGYLSSKGSIPHKKVHSDALPYFVLKNDVIYFRYDNHIPDDAFILARWISLNDVSEKITKVVFEKSFANYQPTETIRWFSDCKSLIEIEGMANLNTERITNMSGMFYGCNSLKTLDLSHLNTKQVTNMRGMFEYCSNLVDLDITGFDTQNVESTDAMFLGCNKLTTLDLSSFNTAKVTNMDGMFNDCTTLKTILVGKGWNTALVRGKEEVQYYYVNYYEDGGLLFTNCPNLIGGKGTKFNPEKTDKEYARIDGGISAPGYFTEKK